MFLSSTPSLPARVCYGTVAVTREPHGERVSRPSLHRLHEVSVHVRGECRDPSLLGLDGPVHLVAAVHEHEPAPREVCVVVGQVEQAGVVEGGVGLK